MTRRPRGICPACGQERRLRASGTLAVHNRLTRQGYNIGPCSGVDQTPRQEPMTDNAAPADPSSSPLRQGEGEPASEVVMEDSCPSGKEYPHTLTAECHPPKSEALAAAELKGWKDAMAAIHAITGPDRQGS